MTTNAFFLLLRRQVTQKWGRFLLASAGIMIGVWAILLTTGLSIGLSDTIIQAINSQPSARLISLYKLENNKTSFFELDGPPKFVAVSQKEVAKVAEKNSEILEISPSEILGVYLHTDKADSQTNCNALNKSTATTVDPATANIGNIPSINPSFVNKCLEVSIPSNVFENFYQTNRTNWYGKTTKPQKGEIATCFKCGGLELNTKLGVGKPEDMVGKTLKMEIHQAPSVQIEGTVYDVTKPSREPKFVKDTQALEFKITSVVDDRNSPTLSLFGGASNNFFLDFNYFTDAIKQADPSFNIDKSGFIEYIVFLKNYNNLESVSNSIRGSGYVAFSLVEGVVNGVKVAFLVLAGILAAFGFIALIASLFGIVNVMIISVLERQKQIGVLKALGSRDRDIFNLFLIESSILGVLGWLLGSIAALISGGLIGLGFQVFLNLNPGFVANLNNLNITSFSPNFPWWAFAGTLVISVFFTSLAGIYPALKASKQNPIDVLRNE